LNFEFVSNFDIRISDLHLINTIETLGKGSHFHLL